MSQVQIPSSDHCIWWARINPLCKSGLDCKSSLPLKATILYGGDQSNDDANNSNDEKSSGNDGNGSVSAIEELGHYKAGLGLLETKSPNSEFRPGETKHSMALSLKKWKYLKLSTLSPRRTNSNWRMKIRWNFCGQLVNYFGIIFKAYKSLPTKEIIWLYTYSHC